jgi:Short C-terminal domain
MTFWEVFWLMITWYFILAYFVIMIRIVIDIFRSDDLGGVSKALWVFCLLVLPFFSALFYLISRGAGMAERSNAGLQDARAQQDAYIRDAAGTSSAASAIAEAKRLLDAGTIDEAEFAALKAKALA